MHKLVAAAAIAAAGIAVVAAPGANAEPSSKSSQLACFDGTTDGVADGSCVRDSSSFVLDANNESADPDGAYAGVYLTNKSLSGKSFATVTSLGFSYDGAVSGGSPRFSLPIVGSDGRDGWVFIDAASCNDGEGHVAPLADPTCVVSGYYWNPDGSAEQTEGFYYTNWSDFLAGEPGAEFGSNYAFVIADQPGIVTVSNVVLGNAKQR